MVSALTGRCLSLIVSGLLAASCASSDQLRHAKKIDCSDVESIAAEADIFRADPIRIRCNLISANSISQGPDLRLIEMTDWFQRGQYRSVVAGYKALISSNKEIAADTLIALRFMVFESYQRLGEVRNAKTIIENMISDDLIDPYSDKNSTALAVASALIPGATPAASGGVGVLAPEMQSDNRWLLAAHIGDQPISILIDTGAEFSVVGESLAKEFRFKIVDLQPILSVFIQPKDGVLPQPVDVRLAVIPELSLGGVTLTNIHIAVVPDNALAGVLDNPNVMILGDPTLRLLKKIAWDGKGKQRQVRVGPEAFDINCANATAEMYNFNNGIGIIAKVAGSSTPVFFDSGAINSIVLEKSRIPYRSVIERRQRLAVVRRLPVGIGDARIVLRDVPISSKSNIFAKLKTPIILGEDFITRSHILALDYESMKIGVFEDSVFSAEACVVGRR